MIRIILLLNFLVINYSVIAIHKKVKIKEISPYFDKKGYPKATTIKSLLTAQYLQHYNQKVAIKQINGGVYSEKMYVATTKKNGKKTSLFYFKISKKSDSTRKLIQLQEGPIGEKFKNLDTAKRGIPITSKKNIPHIIWLENIYTYLDPNGKKRNIEVTPAAQGQLVQNILDSENKTMIKKTGHALGKSLAAFHQLFMNYNDSLDPNTWRTIYHGDFSVKNTLFDSETDQIYFIDNEDMHEGSIAQDIKTILISLLMFRYLKKHFSTRWPLFLEYCQSFLNGYIESYSIKQKKPLALFIKTFLNADLNKKMHTKIITNSSLSHTKFNEQEFKKVINKYLHSFN